MEINTLIGSIDDIESLEVYNPKRHSIILNNVNCQGSLGNVIGWKLREKYPMIEQPYLKYVNSVEKNRRRVLLGTVLPVPITTHKQLLHIFTQLHWGKEGRFVDYEAFYKAMKDVQHKLGEDAKYFDVYFPNNIGCDQAGGNWKIINTIIEETLGKINCNLYAVKYISSGNLYQSDNNFNYKDNFNR
jgi:hypothetical protein